jgi:hypothetical protein
MNPEQIYQQLIELAERLRITVSEKNLRQGGLRARSGLCKVHGESIYVMDKAASTDKKVELLAGCLGQQPLEEVFVVPAVRAVIEKNSPPQPARESMDGETPISGASDQAVTEIERGSEKNDSTAK